MLLHQGGLGTYACELGDAGGVYCPSCHAIKDAVEVSEVSSADKCPVSLCVSSPEGVPIGGLSSSGRPDKKRGGCHSLFKISGTRFDPVSACSVSEASYELSDELCEAPYKVVEASSTHNGLKSNTFAGGGGKQAP